MPSLADDTINNGECLMILVLLQNMSRGGPKHAADLFQIFTNGNSGGEFLFRFVPVPYEQSMRRLNEFYDGALAALRQPAYPEKAAALKLWDAEIDVVAKRYRPAVLLGSDWPILLFLPAVIAPDSKWEIARMQNRLTRIVLALEAFKSDHQSYPNALAELAPTDIATVPLDLFTEKPVVYSRSSTGYTLHSAGPDMIDDGGQSQGKGDDIVASSNIVAKP